MTLFSCENITMRYENIIALRDVSFSVERGDYICIVGPNGAGKSTLLKGILGLRPLESGRVNFVGVKRAGVGYLPQQTAPERDFPASVREVVLSGRLGRAGLRPFYSREDRRAADAAMSRFGIENLARRSFGELSGGQRQRVLLARALAATDSIIFLDEPVSGLDPRVTNELYDLVDGLNRDGVAVVMVSHDVREAVRRAGKILHIDGGVRFFGNTADYLGTRAARELLGREGDA